MLKHHTSAEGLVRISLGDGHSIICVLSGNVTAATFDAAKEQVKAQADRLIAAGHHPKLLIDIRAINGQGRMVIEQLRSFAIDRIAILCPSHFLTIAGRYITQVSGTSGYTRFFTSQQKAEAWLFKPRRTATEGIGLRLALAFGIIGISATALLGWSLGIFELSSIIRGFKLMNPIVAIMLIALAMTSIFLNRNRLRRWWAFVLGGWCVLFGVLVLLHYFTGIDNHIDQWLFGDNPGVIIQIGRASASSALCFILVGAMLIVTAARRKRWQLLVFHASSIVLFLICLVMLVGYSYGLDHFVGPGSIIPMSLNTTICLLLLNYALRILNPPFPIFKRIRKTINTYKLAAAIGGLILLLTGVAWQQSQIELQNRHTVAIERQLSHLKDAINGRLSAYTTALQGFGAFFESSDNVTAGEFRSFFVNSDLSKDYPGFSAFSFIRSLPASDKDSFTVAIRRQESGFNKAYGSFTIHPNNNNAVLYPLVFAEPVGFGNGLDLSTDDELQHTLERARDTGQPTSTSTIDLNFSDDAQASMRPGFLISNPVYHQDKRNNYTVPKTMVDRQERIFGFVSAVFEDKILFDDIFKFIDQPTIRFTIQDNATNNKLYGYNDHLSGLPDEPSGQQNIAAVGQQWKIVLYAPQDFGKDGFEQLFPILLLIGGGILAFLAGGLLISQARRREQALHLAREMTKDLSSERSAAVAVQHKDEAILSSIGDGVFAIDKQQRITLFNPTAERISGWRADEVIGKHYKQVLQFIYEKDSTLNDSFIQKALAGHASTMQNHTLLVRRSGAKLAVGDSAAPIRDSRNRLLGAIVIFRDISKELALDRAKTEFVSLASHQLRTPLAAINWFCELLLDGDAGAIRHAQREYLQEIHDGNQRMIELVNSLLDVSRLDLGKLPNTPTPTSIQAIAKSVQQELTVTITEKQIALTADIAPRLPDVVADPKLLRMVVQNLLSNAVKYTPKAGKVTLTMRIATSTDLHQAGLRKDGDHLFLSVADTGFGIPKSQQDKIFEKLFRADNVRSMNLEGTGLGLYIVKQVAQKLGGQVWFESTEKVGTTFYVVLPFKTKAS